MPEQATIEQAMRRALDLASRGPALGANPQVGCVLLDASGRVVAEGWHRGAGTAHAEVDALSKLPTRAWDAPSTLRDGREATSSGQARPGTETGSGTGSGTGVPDARGLTAVVTLEPCNHTGRTGPCSVALIAAGITEVYYAVSDPGPLAGGGAERLTAAGVSVMGGVLASEASEFQHAWLTAARHRRPYVTAKWASTIDGRAAAADGSSRWITGTAARQRVHEQREASDAILVGTGTVLADDPSLTARGDAGELLQHQPIPVVVGERRVPDDARLRTHPAGLVETGSRDLPTILTGLFERGIRRVFVEGGPKLVSALVAADLVDEYAIYLAPSLLGGGGLALGDIGVDSIAEIKKLDIRGVEQLGDDLLVTARAISTLRDDRCATSSGQASSMTERPRAAPSTGDSPEEGR